MPPHESDDAPPPPTLPWARTAWQLLGLMERAAWCARALIYVHAAVEPQDVRRVTERDLRLALDHLRHWRPPVPDPHRVELERILLEALASGIDGGDPSHERF